MNDQNKISYFFIRSILICYIIVLSTFNVFKVVDIVQRQGRNVQESSNLFEMSNMKWFMFFATAIFGLILMVYICVRWGKEPHIYLIVAMMVIIYAIETMVNLFLFIKHSLLDNDIELTGEVSGIILDCILISLIVPYTLMLKRKFRIMDFAERHKHGENKEQ